MIESNRKVVLLQIRDDRLAEEQERLCFLESCGLRPEELTSINIVSEPKLEWSQFAAADAILIGGAGAHSATERYEFSDSLDTVVKTVVEKGKPMFGSCFGHHFLAKALGGSLVTDHHLGEVGTFDIHLTEAGRSDPMLAGFPVDLPVQLGHHDYVKSLPDSMVELAFSDRCRYQLLRVTGKPIYCSQFHSEMSESHLRARLEMYRDSYLRDQTTDEDSAFPLRPSPWSEKLLPRFFDLYV